ncbi:MAG: phosphoribosyltransferase, partial [Nitrososphaerota archaeon]|nr:phosphoribosyltransferase [Nitrososphaerota archaeon]
MEVQGRLSEPESVLLIDDIITRGATLLGAANRLADAFPNARISAFAAMRTVSNPDEFQREYDPQMGNVRL